MILQSAISMWVIVVDQAQIGPSVSQDGTHPPAPSGMARGRSWDGVLNPEPLVLIPALLSLHCTLSSCSQSLHTYRLSQASPQPTALEGCSEQDSAILF